MHLCSRRRCSSQDVGVYTMDRFNPNQRIHHSFPNLFARAPRRMQLRLPPINIHNCLPPKASSLCVCSPSGVSSTRAKDERTAHTLFPRIKMAARKRPEYANANAMRQNFAQEVGDSECRERKEVGKQVVGQAMS